MPGLAWLSWGFRGVDPFGPPGDFPADSISFVCEFLRISVYKIIYLRTKKFFLLFQSDDFYLFFLPNCPT